MGCSVIHMTNRKPTVEYDGQIYIVRSARTEIPDLDGMSRMAALIWLNQNTYARGAGIRTQPRPNLHGLNWRVDA
jgi:hypothetical protein